MNKLVQHQKARICLNLALRGNNAFFCPDSYLHLDITNPIREINRVSISIIRGLIANTLIDVDGVIDVENMCFKAIEIKEEVKEEIKEEIKEEPVIKEKKTKSRSKKKAEEK